MRSAAAAAAAAAARTARSVGMLQARSTIDGIFSDLGLTTDSLTHLKVGLMYIDPLLY
jgi:hypothetical protein